MVKTAPPNKVQQGSTLIEVLVAIVILAIALLGMAGLTSSSLQYNQLTRMRATGLSLVNDYAERVRVNLIGFDNDKYKKEDDYTRSTRTTATTDPTAAQSCDAALDFTVPEKLSECAEKIAGYDQEQWLLNVANRLPGGSAYITTWRIASAAEPLPPTRMMDIWLIWQEIDQAAGMRQSHNCPKKDNKSIVPAAIADSVSCMYFRIIL